MSLVKFHRRPVSPFSRMLNDFFNDDISNFAGTESYRSVPRVNVAELDEQFRIELAAPGLNKEAFKLNLDHDRLTISAEVETKNEETNEKYTRREFSFRSFERSFVLPDTVNTTNISAKYEDGILRIVLPKREEAVRQPRMEIEVS